MTQKQVFDALSASGIVPSYGLHVGEFASLPLLEYQFAYGDRFGADDIAWSRSSTWFARLYTSKKDPATEADVEAAISAIAQWDKTESYLSDEDVFEIVYTFETLD